MALTDVMALVVEEKSGPKGEKKHYIPFDKAEFERMRVAFKKPDLMPNDLKLILLAIADGKFDIIAVK
jgi:hypothetical protein